MKCNFSNAKKRIECADMVVAQDKKVLGILYLLLSRRD